MPGLFGVTCIEKGGSLDNDFARSTLADMGERLRHRLDFITETWMDEDGGFADSLHREQRTKVVPVSGRKRSALPFTVRSMFSLHALVTRSSKTWIEDDVIWNSY